MPARVSARSNRITAFGVFLLALGVFPRAIAPLQAASPSIPWNKIIWLPANVGDKTIQHAALMLEVRLDGVKNPVLMQLDTGCDSDLVDGAAYERFDKLPLKRRQVSLSGTVAGSRVEHEQFFVRTEGGVSWLQQFLRSIALDYSLFRGKPILFGTIGAAFLEQRTLVLDFVAQRVAILPKGEEMPPAIAQRISFAPLEYRDRKFFVEVTLNGVRQRDLAFDTGSSAMAIATTQRRWLEWTGQQPDDPRNRVMTVKAWDKYARLVGAPLKGSLCVGEACLPAPLAFFESTGLQTSDFDRYPLRIAGLIGNVLFDGRYTVIVDVPHRRFGLFAGSLAF